MVFLQLLRRNIPIWNQSTMMIMMNASPITIMIRSLWSKNLRLVSSHRVQSSSFRVITTTTTSASIITTTAVGTIMIGILSTNNTPLFLGLYIDEKNDNNNNNNNQCCQHKVTTTVTSNHNRTTTTTHHNNNHNSSSYNFAKTFGMITSSSLQHLRLLHRHYYDTNNNNFHRFTYCDSMPPMMTTTDTAATTTPTTPTTTTVTTHPTTTTMTTQSNIQRQMTSIGRFALVSETKYNPSIITFVLQLENNHHHHHPQSPPPPPPPFTTNDLVRLWTLKQMPQRHPRFHQTIQQQHDSTPGMAAKSSSSSSSLAFHPTIMTNIAQHVTESILPGNRYELQRIIGKMQLTPWDLSDSLWQITICNNNITNSIMSTPTPSGQPSTSIPTTFLTHAIMDGIDPINANTANDVQRLPPTLLLFRGHHVLADGASMAAAFMDLFDEAEMLRNQIRTAVQQYRVRRQKNRRRRSIWHWLWRKWVQYVQLCYGTMKSFIHMIRLVYYQVFIDQNPWKVIRQRNRMDNEKNATEPDQRIVSWSDVAPVEQVKWVADTLSDNGDGKRRNKSSYKITVNDIFIACVTAAMSKQLQYHRQRMQELSLKTTTKKQKTKENTKVLDEQKFIHIAVPVHLKGGVVLPNESVSNCIGALVARVPCEMLDDEGSDRMTDQSVQRLRAVSTELHAIKRTPTAVISFMMAKVLSSVTTWNILPTSWMSYLYANANAGSMVVISNNRGPSIPVHIDGHKVESITGFVPLPPGIPVGVVVMSYAGRMNCALSAEPWAVPDGDQFMIWILEEYLQLVNAAKLKQSQQKQLQ